MKIVLTIVLIVFFSNLYSQNNFEDDIKGVWKIKQKINYDTCIDFNDYVRFKSNEIHFFTVESGIEVVKSILKYELIYYFEFHSKFITGQLIKLFNGEVWELNFKEIDDEIRLIWTPKKNKEGEYISVVNHRGIIKDPERRKTAYEKESGAYYIKVQ